ncbi:MAG: hypothetical protein FJX18_02890 [Alphaproteobacteria bacterium]|nr:hypothetical protein [Alphaproteobacteria bacterium]
MQFLCLVFFSFLCLAEGTNASAGGGGSGPVVSEAPLLWANDFNFGLHDLSFHAEYFAKATDDAAENIRSFYKSYDERGVASPTTHFAEVIIVFKDIETKKTHAQVVEPLFLSGNFSKTVYLTERREDFKEEVIYWPVFFQNKATKRQLIALVDCYPSIEGKDLRIKPLLTTTNDAVRKLIEDFKLRGIETGVESMWNPTAHSHSEQAFLSYVLQGHISIPMHPESITILINGYHEPCDQCSAALNHLLKDALFKREFIRKLFPSAPRPELISLNIFYVISDKEPVRNKTHGLDYIDLKAIPSYFIQSRK